MRTLSLGLLLIGCIATGHAAIYKEVDADGNVRYTDRPTSQKAREITPEPLNTVPAQPTGSSPQNQNSGKQAASAYQAVEILKPGQDEVIRENTGALEVELSLQPGLAEGEGHQIVLTLDGTNVYTGNSSVITLDNIARGTHNLQARIIDESGDTLISSPSLTFHMKQQSALFNKKPPPPPPKP